MPFPVNVMVWITAFIEIFQLVDLVFSFISRSGTFSARILLFRVFNCRMDLRHVNTFITQKVLQSVLSCLRRYVAISLFFIQNNKKLVVQSLNKSDQQKEIQ